MFKDFRFIAAMRTLVFFVVASTSAAITLFALDKFGMAFVMYSLAAGIITLAVHFVYVTMLREVKREHEVKYNK